MNLHDLVLTVKDGEGQRLALRVVPELGEAQLVKACSDDVPDEHQLFWHSCRPVELDEGIVANVDEARWFDASMLWRSSSRHHLLRGVLSTMFWRSLIFLISSSHSSVEKRPMCPISGVLFITSQSHSYASVRVILCFIHN